MKITIKINIDDTAGKVTVESTEVSTENSTEEKTYSQYARFFDESCPNWTKDQEYNLRFLIQQQKYANDKLKNQGYLFLNDVYDMLGLPRSKAGQLVGWVYDPENGTGDNYVDFGIYNLQTLQNRAFVNGYERNILLDFNVDGLIFDKMN